MIARTSLGDLSRALVEELAAAGLDPRAVHAHHDRRARVEPGPTRVRCG